MESKTAWITRKTSHAVPSIQYMFFYLLTVFYIVVSVLFPFWKPCCLMCSGWSSRAVSVTQTLRRSSPFNGRDCSVWFLSSHLSLLLVMFTTLEDFHLVGVKWRAITALNMVFILFSWIGVGVLLLWVLYHLDLVTFCSHLSNYCIWFLALLC